MEDGWTTNKESTVVDASSSNNNNSIIISITGNTILDDTIIILRLLLLSSPTEHKSGSVSIKRTTSVKIDDVLEMGYREVVRNYDTLLCDVSFVTYLHYA